MLLRNESVRSLRARSERSERSGLKDLEERQRKVSGTRHATRNQDASHTASVRDTAPYAQLPVLQSLESSFALSALSAFSVHRHYAYIVQLHYRSNIQPVFFSATPRLSDATAHDTAWVLGSADTRHVHVSSCSCTTWARVRRSDLRRLRRLSSSAVAPESKSLEEAPAVLESVRLGVVVGRTEEDTAELRVSKHTRAKRAVHILSLRS